MAKNQNNNTVAPATKKTEPEAKKDALATALAQIEKQFGKGAVMTGKVARSHATTEDTAAPANLSIPVGAGHPPV